MSPRRALAGFVLFGLALPTCGADAAPKRGAPPETPTAVTLENKRRVALQSFEIVMAGKAYSGSASLAEIIVGKLERPLPGGETVSLTLDKPKGCLFEARWKFEDADDGGAVDLCNGAHIVLVD
ncbi:MAG TPA: hypothetical protein VIF61_13495 [Methylocystis sp.]